MPELNEKSNFHLLTPLLASVASIVVLAGSVEILNISLGSWTTAFNIISVVFVIATIYYSLENQKFLGGEIGRNLSLIAAGIAIYGLVFHLITIPYYNLGTPVVYGLSSSFWLAATHGLQIFGISIAAYGFYLMWRSSQ